eukprot:gene3105-6005_t
MSEGWRRSLGGRSGSGRLSLTADADQRSPSSPEHSTLLADAR